MGNPPGTVGNRTCRSFGKTPKKPVTIQQKRALPWPETARSLSWDKEAERSKAEATLPLVPSRNEDFVSRDDSELGICKICVHFGMKYFSVTFVMAEFLHLILNW